MNKDNTAAVSPHALPPLPYPDNALAPVISANTLGFHYGKLSPGICRQPEQGWWRERHLRICRCSKS